MAKEPEEKAFRLLKELDGMLFTMSETPGIWDITVNATEPGYGGTGWEAISGAGFLWQGTIDIRGVTMRERTLFFASNVLQRPLPYASTLDPAISGGLEIWDQIVVSDVPLENAASNTKPWSMTAGFYDTEDDFTQVKLGRGFISTSNLNTPQVMTVIDSYSFGSGDPTATNKLYLYRWISFATDNATWGASVGKVAGVPPMRYVATGLSTEEPDMIWMNRLRKSFENYQRA